MDIEAVTQNPEIARKLFGAGYFYGDIANDVGITSVTLRGLGFTDREMRSGNFQRRIHPEDWPTYEALWKRVSAGWEDELYCEYRLQDTAGEWHWILTHAVVIERGADGSISKVVGSDRDISSRKQAEVFLRKELLDAERRYEIAESLRRTSTIVSADLELTTSLGHGVEKLKEIVDFDRCEIFSAEGIATVRLLSYPEQENSTTSEEEVKRLRKELESSHYPMIQDDADGEYPSRLAVPLRSDAEIVGMALLSSGIPGTYGGADLYPVLAFADILTVAIQNNQQYRRTVSELERDELTGFLTRRRFDQDANLVWAAFCDAHPANSVAMIDIDHFKAVNDRYGHPVGDKVIAAIATCFRTLLRSEDTLARFGGEEFIVLLPNADGPAATEIMERLREGCENLPIDEVEGPVTISIGLASANSWAELSVMIDRADNALYRAKRKGRNRVELG